MTDENSNPDRFISELASWKHVLYTLWYEWPFVARAGRGHSVQRPLNQSGPDKGRGNALGSRSPAVPQDVWDPLKLLAGRGVPVCVCGVCGG